MQVLTDMIFTGAEESAFALNGVAALNHFGTGQFELDITMTSASTELILTEIMLQKIAGGQLPFSKQTISAEIKI